MSAIPRWLAVRGDITLIEVSKKIAETMTDDSEDDQNSDARFESKLPRTPGFKPSVFSTVNKAVISIFLLCNLKCLRTNYLNLVVFTCSIPNPIIRGSKPCL